MLITMRTIFKQYGGEENVDKRVVITGLGVVSPIGVGVENLEKSLRSNSVGIGRITHFEPSEDFPVKIAAQVNNFDPTQFMDKKLARRYDRVLQFAIAAAKMAVEDAGIEFDEQLKSRTGVLVTSGIGGFTTLWNEAKKYMQNGPSKVSPFLVPMMLPDMVSGVVSMEFGLKGPNFSPLSACASSAHSIILGTMFIESGLADVVLVGGAEASIAELSIAAFASMRALSTRNDEPEKASRPFDKGRDGFVMGEGGAVMILEREDLAKARGAKIYGVVKGYGMTGDAYHLSAPDPEGAGAARAMKLALEKAGLPPDAVQYVNPHATSTPAGDEAELKAIKKVMGSHAPKVMVSSTKGLAGHLLGAAGAFETLASVVMMNAGFVHGNPNLDDPDDECAGLDVLGKEVRECEIENFISNSFGFGGHNASVLIGRE